MKTAEEFLNDSLFVKDGLIAKSHCEKQMIEFAKMHVKEALKEAKLRCFTEADDILNAYPETNIK